MPQDNERIISILADTQSYIATQAKQLIDAGAPPHMMIGFFEFLARFQELPMALSYREPRAIHNNSIESYLDRVINSIDTMSERITDTLVDQLSNVKIDPDSDY